ncbi:GGDEF domain-containing protein [Chitinibacter tainanensis]|uniref:GGDEF domain-containing protein n=1 Tax=Chitinibacter tainanensis TaxID=230667 RepID=UPI000429474D|nr:GGDEF domain-containing protein [Chitinibacter tainanensis]
MKPTLHFQPLAHQLLRQIMWLALATVLLMGGVRAWLVYQQSQTEQRNMLRTVAEVYVPQLAVSVWDIEPANLRSLLLSMVQYNRHIAYVELQLRTGRVFRAGDQAHTHGSPPLVFALYAPDAAQYPIGELRVYADREAYQHQLWQSVGLAIGGYLLLTITICGWVLLVLRRHLQQPLQEIASFAANLNAEALLTPLKLTPRPQAAPTEIDLVASSIDMLQNELAQHINMLDQRVAERTSQLEMALQSIQLLSMTDQLTGCYNRHYLNEQLDHIFASAAQQPVALVFTDIDHFKRVNDTYGHKTGDDVLQAVGQTLRGGLRGEQDWVARYGGEEFLLVLPQTALARAGTVAERLRQSIAGLAFSHRLGEFSVSSSFGVVEQRPGESLNSLLERADQLLYRAKQRGRNRVELQDTP